jgi:hypothetical protein
MMTPLSTHQLDIELHITIHVREFDSGKATALGLGLGQR